MAWTWCPSCSVRIQPRTPHALEECEHGTLLAPPPRPRPCARCVDHVNSHGAAPLALSVPLPAEWANVHMCAARAVPRRFGPNITLYAPGGMPGAPTDDAGSYAWQLSVGIGPVDADLLKEVHLIPCAPDSARPGLGALEPFCRNFHGQAVKLFKALGRPPLPAQPAQPAQPPQPPQPSTPPQTLQPAEETEADDDVASPYPSVQFTLTALRLDLHSPRCTIGEALAYLMAHQGPLLVVELFKSAARPLGLATPLVDAGTDRGRAGRPPAAASARTHRRRRRPGRPNGSASSGCATRCSGSRRRRRRSRGGRARRRRQRPRSVGSRVDAS